MSYIYLASPYSHPEPSMREARYLEALRALNFLLHEGTAVYSPIVHCHPLSTLHSAPFDAEFWKWYDQTMIRFSHGVMILQIEGWRESKGVQAEIAFANMLGIEVRGLQVLVSGGFKIA